MMVNLVKFYSSYIIKKVKSLDRVWGSNKEI